jgi:hypothetical protein
MYRYESGNDGWDLMGHMMVRLTNWVSGVDTIYQLDPSISMTRTFRELGDRGTCEEITADTIE